MATRSTRTQKSYEYDVVVVGYGGAGATAAIEAADVGATVLLTEKMPHLGGTTILSGGYMRIASEAEGAAAYLAATNGGRVDRALVDTFARGMVETPAYLEWLADRVDAEVEVNLGDEQDPYQTSDLYDWPGRETLGWAGIRDVPDFDGYPWVHFAGRGENLMRVLEANVTARDIDVWFDTPAQRLIEKNGDIVGIVIRRNGEEVDVRAAGGVILACGGFEFDEQMLQDFLELPTVYSIGHPGNTGDGIRMAQQVGATLWHTWHIHGSYGFKFPEHPMGIRNHLGGTRRNQRPVAWILVDQHGKRFTNEVHPAPQDTGWRPLEELNPETGAFDRIPAWMIFDDAARRLGPIAKPVASVSEHYYEWSDDNAEEVERGWIRSADTIQELAQQADLPPKTLAETIACWNATVAAGDADEFDRPPGTMVPVATPPFFAVPVWPICSNTQGGPKHDEHQRVLDAFGEPIPGLYAAGEFGSLFGHIYLLGGNLTECLVGGWTAGRRAGNKVDRCT